MILTVIDMLPMIEKHSELDRICTAAAAFAPHSYVNQLDKHGLHMLCRSHLRRLRNKQERIAIER